jgi:hypothetical protein
MRLEIPLTRLVDRSVISTSEGIEIVAYQKDGVPGLIFRNSPDARAAGNRDNRIFVKDGRDAQQGQEPYVIIPVQVQLYDIVVGKPVLFCEVAECPAVKSAYSLVGGEPDEAVVILQALIDDGAGQPILHGELFV